ncbi:hypothetical protein AWJ20_2846 [Sugiyamaella lignohabitans]|uniref:Protein PNS1 n=1 Tax=Sugiyamaella lignohabitans TaxID=796027 RepID=A0A167FF40_9ASCO|nr:uncharacterized protein AWJ20_2846 [Sugiyamaella lignohabitans]ANB15221.1 hypothetical protein AWJ20_2846 [Sugiyamaella lignohabitans]
MPKYIRGDDSSNGTRSGSGAVGGSRAGGPYRSSGAHIGIRSREQSEDEDGEAGTDAGFLGLDDGDINVNMISSNSDVGDSFTGGSGTNSHADIAGSGRVGSGGGSSTSTIGKKKHGVLESVQLHDNNDNFDEDDALLNEPPQDITVEGTAIRDDRQTSGRIVTNLNSKNIKNGAARKTNKNIDHNTGKDRTQRSDFVQGDTNNYDDANIDEERQIGMRVFIPPDFLPNGGHYDDYDSAGPGINDGIGIQTTQAGVALPDIPLHDTSSVKFDAIWANIYLGFVSMVLATSLMIWLTTSIPSSKPLGDTIYTILQSSRGLLFIYTLSAIILSVVWVYFMKRYASMSVWSLVVIVPLGLVGLTIYPFVMSFKGTTGSSQSSAMRWTSFVPLILGSLWVYMLYKGRHALGRSLGIINLACSILGENKPLMLLSVGIVFVFSLISILWIALFSRLFLQGHTIIDHGKSTWVLDPKSWLLGAAYILMYLWTWGVMSGIHRSTISATVAQWYFHRHKPYSLASASSTRIVQASLQYSVNAQLGTICFSSFLVLLVRLPILVLPSRLSSGLQMVVYTLVSRTSVLSLTSPLALTNATISSQSLVDSAHTMTSIIYAFDDSAMANTNLNSNLDNSYQANRHTGRGHGNNNRIRRSWLPYRLSKILLTACRGLTALFMGFGAWIHTSSRSGNGSLYGYIVGLLAGFIGWVVIGTTEGTLSMIVDAAFICFALDNHGSKGGHCVEADRQFGGH